MTKKSEFDILKEKEHKINKIKTLTAIIIGLLIGFISQQSLNTYLDLQSQIADRREMRHNADKYYLGATAINFRLAYEREQHAGQLQDEIIQDLKLQLENCQQNSKQNSQRKVVKNESRSY